MSLDLKKYRGVATSLAAVGIASRSYSIIDRIANALSYDSVSRALYENSRILENLLRRGIETERTEGIFEEPHKDKKDLKVVKIISKKDNTRVVDTVSGYLADDEQIKNFLEDTSKNIRIARSVASYAMSMIASALSKREEKEV
jgi:CRISPR type I-A-associated protein Csa5